MQQKRPPTKARTLTFIISGAVASAGGIAYAATEAAKTDGNNTIVILTLACSALAQLGSVGFLVKRYMDKVDKSSETIPAMAATLEAHRVAAEAIANGLKSQGTHIEELYKSRNVHEKRIDEIDWLHKTMRCRELLTVRGANQGPPPGIPERRAPGGEQP